MSFSLWPVQFGVVASSLHPLIHQILGFIFFVNNNSVLLEWCPCIYCAGQPLHLKALKLDFPLCTIAASRRGRGLITLVMRISQGLNWLYMVYVMLGVKSVNRELSLYREAEERGLSISACRDGRYVVLPHNPYLKSLMLTNTRVRESSICASRGWSSCISERLQIEEEVRDGISCGLTG